LDLGPQHGPGRHGKADWQFRLADVFEHAWPLVWAGLGAAILLYLALCENDQPIRYNVPSPKRPEKVEILDEPAVKVRHACRSELTPYRS
jgi:hypothetical protein